MPTVKTELAKAGVTVVTSEHVMKQLQAEKKETLKEYLQAAKAAKDVKRVHSNSGASSHRAHDQSAAAVNAKAAGNSSCCEQTADPATTCTCTLL